MTVKLDNDILIRKQGDVYVTIFGNSKIQKSGYMVITSRNEGNNKKPLHILVWERYHNKKVPKGYVIHHIDHNKLNNKVENLKLMKDVGHRRHHALKENNPMYGKHHTDEAKAKLSEANSGENNPFYNKKHTEKSKNLNRETTAIMYNSTGFFCVSKHVEKRVKQGFNWYYRWTDKDGKRRAFGCCNLWNLKDKVLNAGMKWEIINEENAQRTIELNNKYHGENNG